MKLTPLLTSPSLFRSLFFRNPIPKMAVSLRCEFRHSSHREAVCQTVCYTVGYGLTFTLYESPLHSSFQTQFQAAKSNV